MGKRIQKKQIEEGVFVETRTSYVAPLRDYDFVQKKYVDEKIASIPSLPSWVGATKPSYNWSEILDKPTLFDTNKLKYERISNLNIDSLLTENGVLKVADGNNLIGSPLQSPNIWWHILAGSHTNTKDYSYYLGFELQRDSNDFWYQKKINGIYYTWKKFIGFEDLNNNGLFREWNLEYGLSTYIGNSNVYEVKTKFSGQDGETLLQVTNEYVHTNKMFDAPIINIHTSGVDYISLNSKDYKLNVKVGSAGRDNGEFKRVLASGYEVPNGVHTRLLTANGENYGLGIGQKQDIDLTGLDESKYYLVYCIVDPRDRVKVRVHNVLDYRSKPSWSTHVGGFSLALEFEQTGEGWGAISSDVNITQYNHLWTNADPVMYVSQLRQSSKMFMYLRGGGKYTLYQWSQVGNSNTWENPRRNGGDLVENGVSLPYCRDWDANLKVVATNIRSYKDDGYGEVTNIYKPVVTREIFLDNEAGSKTNIWTADNELNVGSRNRGGYTKINTAGYKKVGSSEEHFLLGNGEHEHRKFLGRCGEIYGNWGVTDTWIGQTINVLSQCNVDLTPLENNYNISFRKCFAGGQVTFTTTGRAVIFTGDNTFNGGDGSTCVVSAANNKLYIDIRNI